MGHGFDKSWKKGGCAEKDFVLGERYERCVGGEQEVAWYVAYLDKASSRQVYWVQGGVFYKMGGKVKPGDFVGGLNKALISKKPAYDIDERVRQEIWNVTREWEKADAGAVRRHE